MNPDRWLELWQDGGTTITRFSDYICRIIDDIGPGMLVCRRTFIMDNLNSHQSDAVKALIFAAGHRIIFSAPYYPVDGPIEYVFNTLHCALQL